MVAGPIICEEIWKIAVKALAYGLLTLLNKSEKLYLMNTKLTNYFVYF